jgi:hypothetical protein
MNRTIYALVILALMIFTANAQRLISVPPDVVDGLALTIKADSAARTAAFPLQTIYMLKRGGYYPVVSAIENPNFFLWIKAESGTGYKPLLVPSPTTGTTYAYNINFRSSGRLEGLTLEAARPTGGVNNRYINIFNGASLWVKDCEVVHDRGSAFALLSDSCSIYIEDCFIHSHGHNKVVGGNGRVVDIRPTAFQDTIIIRNTTFYNLSDRIIRNIGTTVNYIKFDHNTGLTNQGYHGGLQGGKVRELIVTNNIFFNQIAYGSYKRRTKLLTPNTSEQTQPENTLMFVVTIDTSYLIPQQKITVRNNNVWWEQKYKDIWTKYKDSTEAPGIFTPTIMKSLGADSTKAYFAEPLTFKAPPVPIDKFIDSALLAPNTLVLPENWSFVYQDSLANGFDGPVNASYGTVAQSYTKADGAFPLGDLNWYPAKKAAWLLTSVAEQEAGIPATYTLQQNYPNPFNPSTSIAFSMSRTGFVSVTVYDILGREVSTLVNDVMEAGTHQVSWNASRMSSGVYFYKMQSGSFVEMKKMMLIK